MFPEDDLGFSTAAGPRPTGSPFLRKNFLCVIMMGQRGKPVSESGPLLKIRRAGGECAAGSER